MLGKSKSTRSTAEHLVWPPQSAAQNRRHFFSFWCWFAMGFPERKGKVGSRQCLGEATTRTATPRKGAWLCFELRQCSVGLFFGQFGVAWRLASRCTPLWGQKGSRRERIPNAEVSWLYLMFCSKADRGRAKDRKLEPILWPRVVVPAIIFLNARPFLAKKGLQRGDRTKEMG